MTQGPGVEPGPHWIRTEFGEKRIVKRVQYVSVLALSD